MRNFFCIRFFTDELRFNGQFPVFDILLRRAGSTCDRKNVIPILPLHLFIPVPPQAPISSPPTLTRTGKWLTAVRTVSPASQQTLPVDKAIMKQSKQEKQDKGKRKQKEKEEAGVWW